MWIYEKKLQYPVKIKNPNPALAKLILTQLGGPDGELGASMRYLNQRFTVPTREIAGILTDVGTEDKYCAFTKKVKNIYEGVLFFLIDILIFSLVFPHGALTGSSPFPVLHSRRTKRKAIELRFIALLIILWFAELA